MVIAGIILISPGAAAAVHCSIEHLVPWLLHTSTGNNCFYGFYIYGCFNANVQLQ